MQITNQTMSIIFPSSSAGGNNWADSSLNKKRHPCATCTETLQGRRINTKASHPPPQSDRATRDDRKPISSDILNASCAPYLLVSPSEYITTLCMELSVRTVAELVEVMEECLEVLASVADGTASEEDACFYNIVLGSVVEGAEGQFCRALLAAATAMNHVDEKEEEGVGAKLERAMNSPHLSVTAPSFQPKAVSVGRQSPLSVSAQPFQPTPVSAGRQSPLSFTAQPFQPEPTSAGHQSPFSATAQPFQPKTASTSAPLFNDKGTNRKAVVVEISAPKHATKAPARPTTLPGMEYLVGVDDARQAEKKARARLEKKKAKRVDANLEKQAAMVRHDAKGQKQQNVETKPAATTSNESDASVVKSSLPTPKKPVVVPDLDEMPELDEIMSVLENRSMSKEERQKKIDEMFG
mmetsp:Transcript_35951/g.58617  ORF Transcript_35951/g.58617 Transcript_35951/m.58617 type:complete len:410 (+) Transcript_35951:3-1232(+)